MSNPAPPSPGAKPEQPKFTEWLKALADYAGVNSPGELHVFLIQHECQCTRESTAAWLSGEDPSYEKSRDIIKAFHSAFPELEVWEEYKRFVRGEPFMEGKRQASTETPQTLEQILQQTGLPPGLE